VDRLDDELLAVSRTLCGVAAALMVLGQADRAACHLDQAGDLLEERARVAARARLQMAELQ
jgi:hypothetical protein